MKPLYYGVCCFAGMFLALLVYGKFSKPTQEEQLQQLRDENVRTEKIRQEKVLYDMLSKAVHEGKSNKIELTPRQEWENAEKELLGSFADNFQGWWEQFNAQFYVDFENRDLWRQSWNDFKRQKIVELQRKTGKNP